MGSEEMHQNITLLTSTQYESAHVFMSIIWLCALSNEK